MGGEEFGWASSVLQRSTSVDSKGSKKYVQYRCTDTSQQGLEHSKLQAEHQTKKKQGAHIYRKELRFRVKALGTEAVFKIL